MSDTHQLLQTEGTVCLWSYQENTEQRRRLLHRLPLCASAIQGNYPEPVSYLSAGYWSDAWTGCFLIEKLQWESIPTAWTFYILIYYSHTLQSMSLRFYVKILNSYLISSHIKFWKVLQASTISCIFFIQVNTSVCCICSRNVWGIFLTSYEHLGTEICSHSFQLNSSTSVSLDDYLSVFSVLPQIPN